MKFLSKSQEDSFVDIGKINLNVKGIETSQNNVEKN